MRIFDFPARYATEVATVLDSLRRSIQADEALSDGEAPWPGGFIPKDARAGRICIVVGELPADAPAPVFPLALQPEQRIAS